MEKKLWKEFKRNRLIEASENSGLSATEFEQRIFELRNSTQLNAEKNHVLDELEEYAKELLSSL